MLLNTLFNIKKSYKEILKYNNNSNINMYRVGEPLKMIVFTEHPDYYTPNEDENIYGGTYEPLIAETKPEFYETLIDTRGEHMSKYRLIAGKFIAIVGKNWIVTKHEAIDDAIMSNHIILKNILDCDSVCFVDWLDDEIKFINVW